MTMHKPCRFNHFQLRGFWLGLFLAAGATVWMPVHSQPAYKCGNTYSQKPCEGGTSIDTADKRSAEQKLQAQKTSEREKSAANQLESDRLSQERRDASDLRKANAAQKAATAKTNQTKLRPIKNKKIKPEADTAAEKPVKKTKSKKAKPANGS